MHCFRVSLSSEEDRKWRGKVLTAQLGRLSPWLQCLLDRGSSIAGWPSDVRSLDELALLWGFSALFLALVEKSKGHLDRKLVTPVDGWLLHGCWAHWGWCFHRMFELGFLRQCRPGTLKINSSSLRWRIGAVFRPSVPSCPPSLGSLLRASLSRSVPLPPPPLSSGSSGACCACWSPRSCQTCWSQCSCCPSSVVAWFPSCLLAEAHWLLLLHGSVHAVHSSVSLPPVLSAEVKYLQGFCLVMVCLSVGHPALVVQPVVSTCFSQASGSVF